MVWPWTAWQPTPKPRRLPKGDTLGTMTFTEEDTGKRQTAQLVDTFDGCCFWAYFPGLRRFAVVHVNWAVGPDK